MTGVMADNKNHQKLKKGDYGYLKKGKLTQLVLAFLLLVLVACIFYTGYLKYHNTKNIFTVMAAVSVIPMAKFLSCYIVAAPYTMLEEQMYHDIKEYENVFLLYDLLLSSTERIIHVSIAAIRDNSVYLYIPDPKYKKNEVEQYVRTFLERECKVTTVKMISSFHEYQKAVRALDKNESGKFDERIRQVMIAFSML